MTEHTTDTVLDSMPPAELEQFARDLGLDEATVQAISPSWRGNLRASFVASVLNDLHSEGVSIEEYVTRLGDGRPND